MLEAPRTVIEVVIEVAIEASFAVDRERLAAALRECATSDKSFHVKIDRESGQTIIGGVCENHLTAKVDTLRHHHKIELTIGAPQIAYRETLTKRVEKDYTFKRRAGGAGQFARVKMIFEPNKPGAGTFFDSKIVEGAVPHAFILGVENGIASVMEAGVLAGYPLVGVTAILMNVEFHETDSSGLTFELASRAAFREALSMGGSVLLEPIMSIEVTTPAEYVGSVVGDLRGRRGRVQNQKRHGDATVVAAIVPFANLLGYANQLNSFSEGRAIFTMVFAGYQPCPTPSETWPPPAAAVALRA